MSMLTPPGQPNPIRSLFGQWLNQTPSGSQPLVQPAPLAQGPTAAGAPNVGGGGYNPLAAGNRVYNGADFAPQRGKIGNGMAGYAMRDAQAARNNAIGKVLGGNGNIPG